MTKESLSNTPRALKARGMTPPSYRVLYMAVLDGRLAAEKKPNGRYEVDLDETAKVFGLTSEPVAA